MGRNQYRMASRDPRLAAAAVAQGFDFDLLFQQVDLHYHPLNESRAAELRIIVTAFVHDACEYHLGLNRTEFMEHIAQFGLAIDQLLNLSPSTQVKVTHGAAKGRAASPVVKFLSGKSRYLTAAELNKTARSGAGKAEPLASNFFDLLNSALALQTERRVESRPRLGPDDLLSQLAVYRHYTQAILKMFSEGSGHFHERSPHLRWANVLHGWAKFRGLPRASGRPLASGDTRWADTTPFVRLIYVVLLAINDYIGETYESDSIGGRAEEGEANLRPRNGDTQWPPVRAHKINYIGIPPTFTAVALMIEKSKRTKLR